MFIYAELNSCILMYNPIKYEDN